MNTKKEKVIGNVSKRPQNCFRFFAIIVPVSGYAVAISDKLKELTGTYEVCVPVSNFVEKSACAAKTKIYQLLGKNNKLPPQLKCYIFYDQDGQEYAQEELPDDMVRPGYEDTYVCKLSDSWPDIWKIRGQRDGVWTTSRLMNLDLLHTGDPASDLHDQAFKSRTTSRRGVKIRHMSAFIVGCSVNQDQSGILTDVTFDLLPGSPFVSPVFDKNLIEKHTMKVSDFTYLFQGIKGDFEVISRLGAMMGGLLLKNFNDSKLHYVAAPDVTELLTQDNTHLFLYLTRYGFFKVV